MQLETKGQIICGFAGIGKSYLAKQKAGVVDLESTPFEKDWDRYIKVVKHMADNRYTVLLSAHKELRKGLLENAIPYTLCLSHHMLKQEYKDRYVSRGDTPVFVEMLDKYWDTYTEPMRAEYVSGIVRWLDNGEYLTL